LAQRHKPDDASGEGFQEEVSISEYAGGGALGEVEGHLELSWLPLLRP